MRGSKRLIDNAFSNSKNNYKNKRLTLDNQHITKKMRAQVLGKIWIHNMINIGNIFQNG